jgi:uncharacterized protein with PQ loop repeat
MLHTGELVSLILGYVSSFAFLFVCLPQLYVNYKNKNTEALRFYLVFLWLSGDIFSIISCKIKNNSYLIIYIGYVHIIFDCIFILQIMYYRYLDIESTEYITLHDSQSTFESTCYKLMRYNIFYKIFNKTELSLIFTSMLITVITYSISGIVVAEMLGWISTCIFICSRIPQIYLNFHRKSVYGLSKIAFFMLMFSNMSFLVSLLIYTIDLESDHDKMTYLLKNIQWIIGSFLSFLFDLILMYQFIVYKIFDTYLQIEE